MFEILLRADYEDNYDYRDKDRALRDIEMMQQNTLGLRKRSKSNADPMTVEKILKHRKSRMSARGSEEDTTS